MPEYVDHIASTMARSGQSLRAGNDREGLNTFARGASDLALFFELVHRLAAIAVPSPGAATTAFTRAGGSE